MASIRKRGQSWRVELYRGGQRESATFDTKREASAWALEREAELSGARLPDKSLADALTALAELFGLLAFLLNFVPYVGAGGGIARERPGAGRRPVPTTVGLHGSGLAHSGLLGVLGPAPARRGRAEALRRRTSTRTSTSP